MPRMPGSLASRWIKPSVYSLSPVETHMKKPTKKGKGTKDAGMMMSDKDRKAMQKKMGKAMPGKMRGR